MSNDIQKYSPVKSSTVTDADPFKQSLNNNTVHKDITTVTLRVDILIIMQHLPAHGLCIDQPVMYQCLDKWKGNGTQHTYSKLCFEPRSYIISTEDGTQYRKMQKHLKPY